MNKILTLELMQGSNTFYFVVGDKKGADRISPVTIESIVMPAQP